LADIKINNFHIRTIYLILGLVIFISFFYNLGKPPLFDRDEGAFSEASREMIERQDYISTFLNDQPRYDKPILIYWLQVISIKIWGLNEFAVRFPSAIAASFWMLAIFLFMKKKYDKETALASGLIAATSLWVIIIGRAAIADALLNLFITLSMFYIFRYFEENQKIYIRRTFLWIALGALTKGPIAIIIPFGVSFIFFLSQKETGRWFKAVTNPVGLLIFIAIALPWYIIQFQVNGMSFIEGFFFKHNVQRFLSPMEGHKGSFLYYIPILLLIVFPFSGLFIRITGTIRRVLSEPLDLFLWLWFGFVLLFFTLSGTKLPHYLLHGCTPIFLLMAIYRQILRSKILAFMPVFFFWVLLSLLPEIITWIIPFVKDELARSLMQEAITQFDLSFRIFNAGMAILSFILILPMKIPLWPRLILIAIAGTFVLSHSVIPGYGNIQQGTIKQLAVFLNDEEDTIVMWGMDNPSFSFYRKRVTPWRMPSSGEIVITRHKRLNKLPAHKILFERSGIYVAKIY